MSTSAASLPDSVGALVGASPQSEAMRAFARRAAAVSAPVLLTGESGTGKGVLARAIHAASRRARAAFVPVNCAGVPESLFESEFFGHTRGAFTGAHYAHRGVLEQAHGGSLFLDEIGELPLPLQAKLLTVLEDGEIRRVGGERSIRVDARLIAATAVDLDAAVAAGRFRLDLYHRLLVLGFSIPPLRERGDDAWLLARHFLARHRARYERGVRGFSEAAQRRIREYGWPGNVRQLSHAIEAAVLACEGDVIRARDLPVRTWAGAGGGIVAEPRAGGAQVAPGVSSRAGLPAGPTDPAHGVAPVGAPAQAFPADGGGNAAERLRTRYSFFGTPEAERACIIAALEAARGNKTRAAAALGMSRNTLRARMRALGVADAVAAHARRP
jgi:DNA-binding NtrC family response regulator